MSDEPKFCKDCKHFRPEVVLIYGYGATPSRCQHPEFRDLVTGIASVSPALMRKERCGTKGIFWEQKPPEPAPASEPAPLQAEPIPGLIQIPTEVSLARWWEFWK